MATRSISSFLSGSSKSQSRPGAKNRLTFFWILKKQKVKVNRPLRREKWFESSWGEGSISLKILNKIVFGPISFCLIIQLLRSWKHPKCSKKPPRSVQPKTTCRHASLVSNCRVCTSRDKHVDENGNLHTPEAEKQIPVLGSFIFTGHWAPIS